MTPGTVEQALQTALVHHQAGRRAEAEAIYREVLAEFPDHAGALHLLGVLAGQAGSTDSAIELIGRAVAIKADVPQYHSNLGEFYCRAGQWDRAIGSLSRAIELKPDLAVAHGNLGNALKAAGRRNEAIAAYRRAIALKGDDAAVQSNLGVVLQQEGHWDEAIAAYRRAIALEPALAEASYNLGTTLRLLGQLDDAITAFSRAVALRPDFAEAHGNLGRALLDAGRIDEAVDALRRAIEAERDDPLAYYQLGNALRQKGQDEAAIAAYRRAIELKPDHALAHNNLGVALEEAGRLDEAVAAYRRAIDLEPGLAEVHYNLGGAWKRLGQMDEAIAAFGRAIELRPDHAESYNNLAGALHDIGRLNEARDCFRKAAELNPQSTAAASNLAFTSYYDPDLDAQAILDEHRRWARRYAEPLADQVRPHLNDRTPERRLRVGFLSPDLCFHPVGQALHPLFLHHDRRHVEFVGYSDVRAPDRYTEQFKSLSEEWHDIVSLSDSQVADRIRADRIDILVDPTLHCAGNRLLVFARKPAPVQVTLLGPPTTTGLTTMDYRLTDSYLDPPGVSDADYTEQSVRLPHSFWIFPVPEQSPPVSALPVLSNGFVTFGCLNQFAKVTRPALDLWVKILKLLPGSRLVLQSPPGSHQGAICALFQQGGIAPERLDFVDRAPRFEYLRRFQNIDLGLDPFPYNGHSSTFDPLWMGVPVITLAGRTVVGRAGVSILSNVGLTELIAHTPEEYIAIAVALARDPARLAGLRAGLRQRMQASPLMDGAQYAKDVEAAFRGMWLKFCEGRGNKSEIRNPKSETNPKF